MPPKWTNKTKMKWGKNTTKTKYRSAWLMSDKAILGTTGTSSSSQTRKKQKTRAQALNLDDGKKKEKMEAKKDVVIDVQELSSKRRTKTKPVAEFVPEFEPEQKKEDDKKEEKQAWSPEQITAYRAIRAGKNAFITGGAGTGKTFVVGQSVARDWDASEEEQTVYFVAPTGSAARQVKGITLHSYLGLNLFFFTRNNIRAVKSYLSHPMKRRKTRERLKRTRLLCIDEISMVTPRDFDWLDEVLRFVRNSRLPFGGVQLLVCGDFFQLPPVIDPNIMKHDTRRYAFQTLAWRRCNFQTIMLTQVFRQKDDLEFYNMLNAVREGNITPAVDVYFQNLCAAVPSGVPVYGISNSFSSGDGGVRGIYLAAYCHVVASCNQAALARLHPSIRPTRYVPEFTLHASETKDDTIQKSMNEKQGEQMKEALVELKVGAMVMLTVNWDVKQGIVHGRRGTVTKIGDDCTPHVVWDDDVTKTAWSIPKYRWFFECTDGVLEMEALPLSLCFAMTYHKAQGLTVPAAVIDFSYGTSSTSVGFGYGLAYVVLSRAPRADRIRLLNWSPQCVQVDPVVKEFYRTLHHSTS